jgi:glycerol kinase
MDSWLTWKLTNGAQHITDATNASRTLLFNIHAMDWDDSLLEILGIPKSMLPEVRTSSEVYGTVDKRLCECGCRIAGMAGDQHAALFAQSCFEAGASKNTYGTGCFLLMNTGTQPVDSSNKLLTTLAWQRDGVTNYALEGSVFIGGAVVQWLRDELGIIESASDVELLAAQVPDSGGVCFVPAFAGLGAPHWDPHARGTIIGLTRGSGKAHIARAALESMCFRSMELLKAMEKDCGVPMDTLRVDGGACANDLLMQIQADLLQIPVERLAGLAVGFWKNLDEIDAVRKVDRIFEPKIGLDEAESRFAQWSRAVERCKEWETSS